MSGISNNYGGSVWNNPAYQRNAGGASGASGTSGAGDISGAGGASGLPMTEMQGIVSSDANSEGEAKAKVFRALENASPGATASSTYYQNGHFFTIKGEVTQGARTGYTYIKYSEVDAMDGRVIYSEKEILQSEAGEEANKNSEEKILTYTQATKLQGQMNRLANKIKNNYMKNHNSQ